MVRLTFSRNCPYTVNTYVPEVFKRSLTSPSNTNSSQNISKTTRMTDHRSISYPSSVSSDETENERQTEKNNAINKGKIDLLDSALQLHALLSVLHSFYHQSSGVAAHISSPVWVIRQRLDYQFNRHHTHIHMCCQMHNILITINTTDFTANRLSPTVNKGFTGYPNLHLRVMTNTRQVNTVQKGFVGLGLVNRCVRLMRA